MKITSLFLIVATLLILAGCDKEIHEARLDRQDTVLASAQK